MTLWLLRHGEAEPRVTTDAARELTPRGCQEIRVTSRQLGGQPLERMLVSPLVRAQQSAQLVREVLGYAGPWQTVDWIVPEAPARQALARLDAFEGEHLLLVTHQDFVGELAGLLTGEAPLVMPTGSLVRLEGEVMAAGLMQRMALYLP